MLLMRRPGHAGRLPTCLSVTATVAHLDPAVVGETAPVKRNLLDAVALCDLRNLLPNDRRSVLHG